MQFCMYIVKHLVKKNVHLIVMTWILKQHERLLR